MRYVLAAVALTTCLNGCAATPVTQQTPRSYDGFSIVPPQGPGWFVVKPGDREVGFAKKSDSPTHVMLVGVERSVSPKDFDSTEDFLQYVNASQFTADPHFYEFLEKDAWLNPSHGEYCVEYRYKYKDYKSPRPKSAPYVLHEGHCFLCLHPLAREREYDICLSEMFISGEEDDSFRRAGEAFIDSIHFTEPDGARSGARDSLPVSADPSDGKHRVFVLQQVPTTFFTILVELDGKEVAQVSDCGQYAQVSSTPGQHAIKVFYGGSGRLDIFNRPERSFELLEGKSSYFVITQKDSMGKLMYNMRIIEVTEDDWRSRARRGAADRRCEGYYKE